MHAMAPTLAHLSLDPSHSAPAPSTPTQGSSYHSCAASANMSSSSIHPNPISYAHSPYHVTHHGGAVQTHGQTISRSRSPAIVSPVPSSAGPGPSSLARVHSSHGTSDRPVSPPPPTPRPLEPVVTTSTIERGRDENERPMINQYLIYQRIGKGQHGEVLKAYDKNRNFLPVVSLIFSSYSSSPPFFISAFVVSAMRFLCTPASRFSLPTFLINHFSLPTGYQSLQT